MSEHRYQDLISLFDQTFFRSHNTRLLKGEKEPIYLPADQAIPFHRIVFAHGFYASALHEIAHWCIAGEARRLLEDYGYWYCADGRDVEQQANFENVEVKPQALEWAFCVAAGKSFRVSTDNLNGVEPDRDKFELRVQAQVCAFLKTGFPSRAQTFIDVLQEKYQTRPLCIDHFQLSSSGAPAVA